MNNIERRLKLVELKTNRDYWQKEENKLECAIANEEPYHEEYIADLKVDRKQITNMITEIDTLIKKLESKKK